MASIKYTLFFLILIIGTLNSKLQANETIRYGLDKNARAQQVEPTQFYFHAMIGRNNLDEDSLELRSDGTTFDGDWDGGLNYFGDGAQFPLVGDQFSLGWEGGAFMSWKTDDVNFAARSNGGTQVRFQIDTIFYGLETYLGAFAAVKPHSRVRLYVGAGPLLQMGFAEIEDDEADADRVVIINGSNVRIQLDETDFDANVGWYARAGAEVKVGRKIYLGVSGRMVRAELDMSDSLGKLSLDGTLVMLSIGAKM